MEVALIDLGIRKALPFLLDVTISSVRISYSPRLGWPFCHIFSDGTSFPSFIGWMVFQLDHPVLVALLVSPKFSEVCHEIDPFGRLGMRTHS
jgi:hypothetical protein